MEFTGYHQYAPRAAGQPLGGFFIFRSARNALETNCMLKRSHLVLLSRRVGGTVAAQRTVILHVCRTGGYNGGCSPSPRLLAIGTGKPNLVCVSHCPGLALRKPSCARKEESLGDCVRSVEARPGEW